MVSRGVISANVYVTNKKNNTPQNNLAQIEEGKTMHFQHKQTRKLLKQIHAKI